MRSKLFFFIILCTAIIFYSCDKESNNTINDNATIQINGTDVSTQARAGSMSNSPDSLFLEFIVSQNETIVASLSLEGIPNTTGSFSVSKRLSGGAGKTVATYTTLVGGDAIEDRYEIDENQTSTVEIVSINNDNIQGDFDLNFIIRDSLNKANPNNPNIIQITSASFAVPLE